MKTQCHDLDDLLRFAEQPRGNAGREHLEECARCQSRLQAYSEFMNGSGALPGEARQAWAAARLQRSIEAMNPAPQAETEPDAGGTSWLTRLFGAGLRPAWAIAGVAVVAVILATQLDVLTPGHREVVLRGPSTASLVLDTKTRVLPSGALEFTWAEFAEADRYEIRLYDLTLAEVMRQEVRQTTSVTLSANDVAQHSSAHFWQIIAFRGLEETGQSDIERLTR